MSTALSRRQVTIYRETPIGFAKDEASAYAVTVGPFAQYRHVPTLWTIDRGKRKATGHTLTDTAFVIVSGWNRPQPPGMFGTGRRHGASAEAYDPAHASDFDSWFARHVSPSDVIADFRHHNPH